MKVIIKLIKRLRCRHRWRNSSRVPGRIFCDLCGAHRMVD